MSPTKFYLYKRPNGYWYIGYWQDGCKQWKSAKTKLKPEALKVLREFEAYLTQPPPRISFDEFRKQFCELQKHSLREGTIKSVYMPAFNSFQRICQNRLLTSYTLKDVETFKNKMLDDGRSPVT